MNSVRALRDVAPISDYLGPAVVRSLGPLGPVVELPDGERAVAELAFAFPYEAREGDVLLVIARGEARYAIGVLAGTGPSVLAFPGDVSLRAGGTLELEGERGVRVRGANFSVLAAEVEVVAESIAQRCASLYSRVKGRLLQSAGEAQTIVEGESLTRARSSTLLTEEEVTINGKQIHLG